MRVHKKLLYTKFVIGRYVALGCLIKPKSSYGVGLEGNYLHEKFDLVAN